EFVEVQPAHVVDAFPRHGEEQARGTQARAFAIRAGALHHDLVEPLLHAGVGFAALPVAAIVAFNAARDAAEADLFALPVVALHLAIGRHHHRDFSIDAVEYRVARGFGQFLPRRVEREGNRLGEAVHDASVPGVGIVLEGLAHEAAAEHTAL